MIHYSCDCCKKILDPEEDLRYVVKMEVCVAMDSVQLAESDDELDHLEEIQDILERLDDDQDENIGQDIYRRMRYDLCSDCHQKFLKNPLGRDILKQLNFSEN